ncbi:MAG: 5-bromo-4-chloroindolyl phosphate hydrolysis family protein [Pseudomonadota bacterium]
MSSKRGGILRKRRGIWPILLTVVFGCSSIFRLALGDVVGFGLGMLMTVAMAAGTWSLRRGLEHQRGEGGFRGRTPGALLIGAATAGMSFLVADHSLVESLILGAAATAGTVMAYGSELLEARTGKRSTAKTASSEKDEVERILSEAKAKRDRLVSARHQLQGGPAPAGGLRAQLGRVAAAADELLDELGEDRKELRSSRRAMGGYILGQRIDRVVMLTDRIFERIREDPRDLRRARKFMNVYLDGAAQVAERLVRLQGNDRDAAAEMAPRMVALLAAMERAAEELNQKLLANDTLDLDVQMEVLQRRLQNEGLS